MSMKSVLAEELTRISLSRMEILGLNRVTKGFIASLKVKGVKAYVGGSLAKGTMIQRVPLCESGVRCQVSGVREEKQDVDIFVVFDYSEDIGKLEGVLKRMKLPGKLNRVHGSRDYFQIDCGETLLEVIPVVKNKDPELAENVTDVSLRHVKYIVGEIKKCPGLADEIKLAKAFCYANRCYGAESYIHGFSGYSLEVLVIFYGSFLNFLKKIGNRRRVTGNGSKIVVDPLKYFKGERDVLNEINASKLGSPVVLVDPTYKYRNVCAGLGDESFEKFKKVASDFLKKPSLDFFYLKEIDVEEMKKMRGTFVEVDLSTDRQEGDIAGTKMKKLLDFFVRELEWNGQKVLRKEFDYSGFGQKAAGYLVVREVKEILLRGPSVGLADACKGFVRVNGDAFKKGKFWWVRKEMSVEKVFELVKRVEGEMGAKIILEDN